MNHDYEKNDSKKRPLRLCLVRDLDVACDLCQKSITNGQLYWRDLQNKGPATHEVCPKPGFGRSKP